MLRRPLGPLLARHTARGLSLIELMVGVAVGLIVVGGAVKLFSTNLAATRRVQAETRLNQDLRAAADLVARDLRRAGYWGNAILGTQAQGATATTVVNPYRETIVSAGTLSYGFSRDTTENNTLDDTERFGFRVQSGSVQMQTAAGVWQTVTDPNQVNVLAFTITPTTTTLGLGHLCPKTCTTASATCPTVQVRRYDVQLQGRSVRYADMVRTLPLSVRVRNERLEGVCPA